MFRAGKKKRNSKAQGQGDRAAGRALPERLGKSPAELHPLQWGGNESKFPSKQELRLACGLCSPTRHSRGKNPTEALKIFALNTQQAYQD